MKGIDEVRSRIQEVQSLLKEAEERIQAINKNLPQKGADQRSCLEKLDEAKLELVFWQNMNHEWEQIVEIEKNRGFVDIDEFDPSAIFTQYESVFAKYDRSKLLEQLTKAFFNEQPFLTEYRMFDFSEDIETPQWILMTTSESVLNRLLMNGID